MPRQIRKDQKYQDKILKMIPSEIVAAYLVVEPLARQVSFGESSEGSKLVEWIVFGVLLALTPLYLARVQAVENARQIALTTASFVVWVYSLGGPFVAIGWHSAALASIILVIWTLAVPSLLGAVANET